MAAKKGSKSAAGLLGMAGGGAGAGGKKASPFAKEAESPDHKKGKAGRVTGSKVKPVLKAQTAARKGGASASRDQHSRSSAAAIGKKGK